MKVINSLFLFAPCLSALVISCCEYFLISVKLSIVGIWGAMSDSSRSFKPWEDGFRKGLYLAGVECDDHAEAPDGWTKWIIPGYEYMVAENHKGAFEKIIRQMNEDGISLAGAVHDYTDPATGKSYLYFPIREV